MLARIKATQIGKTGLRMAALVAGSQLTVAAAKVGSHSAMAGGCGAENAFHLASALGQTVWSMVDACLASQMVHAAGQLLVSDSVLNLGNATASVIGHEVLTHVVSLAFQIFS